MIGAQNNIPNQGKLPLKYQACLTTCPAALVSITGAHVPCTPGGISGFHKLNMSDPHQWRSSPQPPNLCSPQNVSSAEPLMSTITCTASLYATARIPPSMVYRPVSTITNTEPIQKLSITVPPIFRLTSGKSVPNTTPPAKIPTAIFDTINVISDTTDSTYLDLVLKRFSRNSGMVNTIERM